MTYQTKTKNNVQNQYSELGLNRGGKNLLINGKFLRCTNYIECTMSS